MRIWIINYYTGTPLRANNPRYLKLARAFMDAGHEVVTFNSSFAAKTQEEQNRTGETFLERNYGDFKFVHVNAPAYHGNGAKRLFSIWKFASMINGTAKRYEQPNVILHNIHPPFDYPIVKLAKKLRCKYITEAWDLWPESFVRFGLVKESNPLMIIAHSIEKRYYYAADEIIFTLKGAIDYLKQRGLTIDQGGKIDPAHIHYINNGIDLAQFDKDKVSYPRPDKDMNDKDLYKIVYLGTINHANNVKTIIDAVSLLRGKPNYRFFIYGDGVQREKLEQYVKDNHIGNVVFKERHIPFAECAWVVSQATINIMNYEKGYGKWGASSGKLFQYLAAGKPIVCNVNIGYDNVINDNNLGISQFMDKPEEFADSICRIAELPKEEYQDMCERVREVAHKYDYAVLAQRELEVIESLYK